MNAPGIGHNRALSVPSKDAIAEFLAEETAELAAKAHECIICADERSEVVDDESAAKAVQLEATMIELFQDLEKLRAETKRPMIDGGAAVDAHFHAITLPLAGPSPAKKREGAIGDLHARIEAYDVRRTAEKEADRRRLEAEARAQQEAADLAEAHRQAALERAKATDDPRAQEEAYRLAASTGQTAQQLADQAAKTSALAASQVARPIDSGVGPKATRRTNWIPQIIDLPSAVAHCLTIPQFRAAIELVVQRAYGAQVRAGARDTIGADGAIVFGLPGARIVDQTKLTVRRK